MAPFVERAAGARRDRDGDRPAQAPGRGGAARVPPGRPVGGRRGGRWPLVRRARGEPRRRRAGRAVRGLVLFSYPLHPPGSPERTDARIAHWPTIRCPVLLLSGESDPFAKIDLLRASVGGWRNAELVTYPRLGHTLKPVLDDALDRAAAFLRGSAPSADG